MNNDINMNQRIVSEAEASNKGIIRLISASTNTDYEIIKMLLDNGVDSGYLHFFFDEIDRFLEHYENNKAIIKKYKDRNN